MPSNQEHIAFKISGHVLDIIKETSTKEGISSNLAAKKLLTDFIEKDALINDLTITMLKSSVRQLTIVQRYISTQLGESVAAEIFEKAYEDELEILKSLGVDNG